MPFDQKAFQPNRQTAPRQKGAGRGKPIAEETRAEIHRHLLAGRSNDDVIDITGVSDRTVANEKRHLIDEGLLSPSAQSLRGQEKRRRRYEEKTARVVEAFRGAGRDIDSLRDRAVSLGLAPTLGPLISDILSGQTDLPTLRADHNVRQAARVWVERLTPFISNEGAVLPSKIARIAQSIREAGSSIHSSRACAASLGLRPSHGPLIYDILNGQTDLSTLETEHGAKQTARLWLEWLTPFISNGGAVLPSKIARIAQDIRDAGPDRDSLRARAASLGLNPTHGPLIFDILNDQTDLPTLRAGHNVRQAARVWVKRLTPFISKEMPSSPDNPTDQNGIDPHINESEPAHHENAVATAKHSNFGVSEPVLAEPAKQQARHKRSKKTKPKKERRPRLRSDALREALLKTDANIPSIVDEAGLPLKYAVLFQILVGGNRNRNAAARVSGFHYNRVHEWANWLGLPSKSESKADVRAQIIFELSQGNINRRDLVRRPDIDRHVLDEVIATMGIQGQNFPKPLEEAVRAASKAHPDFSNRQIANLLGKRFNFNYVCDIRRKLLTSPDRLPDGITVARLFLNAAVELVKSQIESESTLRLKNIKRRARRTCWISKFEGKMAWPTSTKIFPGTSIPKYRLLAATLTEYLSEAEITGPEELKSRAASGFVQLPQMPLRIFQALHLVLATQDVADRLKIQNGFHQSWLPSRYQMIVTAKQILGYNGNKPKAAAKASQTTRDVQPNRPTLTEPANVNLTEALEAA